MLMPAAGGVLVNRPFEDSRTALSALERKFDCSGVIWMFDHFNHNETVLEQSSEAGEKQHVHILQSRRHSRHELGMTIGFPRVESFSRPLSNGHNEFSKYRDETEDLVLPYASSSESICEIGIIQKPVKMEMRYG
jgi:hypothetical protein